MTTPKCSQCGKLLTDPVSVSQGIGPDCLAKRAQALGAAGSSEAELKEWAVSNDPTLARWARIIVRSCADGNERYVNRFVEDAKRRARELAQNADSGLILCSVV